MNAIAETNQRLGAAIERLMPRILTAASRDPNSATFGSFDRDWWHYRVRDFSTIILQQGAWSAWLAAELPAFCEHRESLTRLAAGGCRFWNSRALRYGAFEEYYPWERGFPAGAFSTRAVMKLVEAGVIDRTEVRGGAAVAAKQFANRLEHEAANQQVAGLAALALIQKLFPDLVSAEAFESQTVKTLALQHAEGWYEEYNGPDLAYLSVTIDALWDLFDVTGDSRFRESAARALVYTHPYVAITGANIGMMNSRNTDYILPYGIVRFLRDGTPAEAAIAAELFTTLYASVGEPNHFLTAVDDRYLCHYTTHSLIRAWSLVRQLDSSALAELPPLPRVQGAFLEGCGHLLLSGGATAISGIVSLKKGGVFSLLKGADRVADFGWVVKIGAKQYVNHWWARDWACSRNAESLTVSGNLIPYSETISNPWNHAALRVVSLIFGERLIPKLKAVLIFKNKRSPFAFDRKIAIQGLTVTVTDSIRNLPSGAIVEAAPRSSKRHVSSADSYHVEDLALAAGVVSERTVKHNGAVFEATTVYRFSGE